MAPLGAALGVAAGFVLGNWLSETLPLESSWNRLPWDRPGRVGGDLVVSSAAACRRGLAGCSERRPRQGPPVPCAEEARSELHGLPAALGAAIFAEWALLEALAMRPPGSGVSLMLALTALSAAAVLIHAGYGAIDGLSKSCWQQPCSAWGPVAWWQRTDDGGAGYRRGRGAAGVLLMGPSRRRSAKYRGLHSRPRACAPLVLALTLLAAASSSLRACCLLPLVIAVLLAAQAGALEIE